MCEIARQYELIMDEMNINILSGIGWKLQRKFHEELNNHMRNELRQHSKWSKLGNLQGGECGSKIEFNINYLNGIDKKEIQWGVRFQKLWRCVNE